MLATVKNTQFNDIILSRQNPKTKLHRLHAPSTFSKAEGGVRTIRAYKVYVARIAYILSTINISITTQEIFSHSFTQCAI